MGIFFPLKCSTPYYCLKATPKSNTAFTIFQLQINYTRVCFCLREREREGEEGKITEPRLQDLILSKKPWRSDEKFWEWGIWRTSSQVKLLQLDIAVAVAAGVTLFVVAELTEKGRDWIKFRLLFGRTFENLRRVWNLWGRRWKWWLQQAIVEVLAWSSTLSK